MFLMPETLKRHVGNDWLPTEATITACLENPIYDTTMRRLTSRVRLILE